MSKPIYQQIIDEMKKNITSMDANAPILSERELSKKYDVSRMTVRKAINELVLDGYLYRDSHKGTFVADKTLVKKNTVNDEVKKEDGISYKIIYFDVKASSGEDVQQHLDIDVDTSIVRMIRLCLKDKVPQSIEEVYIARNNLSDEQFNRLSSWRNFNKLIDEARLKQVFVPLLVPIQYAHLLKMKINDPLIMLETTITKKDGKPFIYMKVYHNPKEKKIEIIV